MAVLSASSSKVADGVQPKGLRVGLVAVTATYSLTVSNTPGDVIQMVKVPKGATPVYVAVAGGAGKQQIDVGDGVNTARYLSDKSSSAAMGLTPINTVYTPYTYSTDDTIDIRVSLVSTSTLVGGYTMVCIYSMDT
jgi:hypothetical protein